MKRLLVLSLSASAVLLTLSAHAANYTFVSSGTTSWSNTGGVTWSPSGTYPNGVGDGVFKVAGSNSTGLTQDVAGGVTIGSINLAGSTANTWTIIPTNGITFNQDGAGGGSASISVNSSNSSSRIVFTSAGTLTLADDLIISNFSNTTASAAGAIQMTSVIAGTGNLTLSSISNSVVGGHIRLEASNTFVGSVSIVKGATTFTLGNSFGNSANAITLGSAGQGSATLVANRTSATAVTLNNNITVAAGTGGVLLLGATPSTASSGTATTTYAGTIVLNGNLSTISEHASTAVSNLVFSNVISGTGGLTTTGTGLTRLTGSNTYTGATSVTAGTLLLATTGTNNISASSSITVATGAALDVTGVTGGFTVASGQTIAGAGTIVGDVTLASGAVLAPGNSPGTLTFDNNLTLLAGSTSNFEINGLTSGLYDLVQELGAQTVSFGGVLNLVFQEGFNTAGTVKIFDFENYDGAFGSVTTDGLADGYTATFNGLTGEVTVAVPEPSSMLLLGLGSGLVLWRLRRRLSR